MWMAGSVKIDMIHPADRARNEGTHTGDYVTIMAPINLANTPKLKGPRHHRHVHQHIPQVINAEAGL